MRAAKVQASLRIRAVSPEPPLLAHTSSESRGTFKQKARSLAPLNGWACAVKICHDGVLEDTNSLDVAQFRFLFYNLQDSSMYGVLRSGLEQWRSRWRHVPELFPSKFHGYPSQSHRYSPARQTGTQASSSREHGDRRGRADVDNFHYHLLRKW